jgi:hypothetical protein
VLSNCAAAAQGSAGSASWCAILAQGAAAAPRAANNSVFAAQIAVLRLAASLLRECVPPPVVDETGPLHLDCGGALAMDNAEGDVHQH